MEPTSTLNPEDVRIGATIKSLREAYGWKLGEFAVAVDRSHAFISNIEAGRKHAPLPLCRKISEVLGVALGAIVSTEYSEAVSAHDAARAR